MAVGASCGAEYSWLAFVLMRSPVICLTIDEFTAFTRIRDTILVLMVVHALVIVSRLEVDHTVWRGYICWCSVAYLDWIGLNFSHLAKILRIFGSNAPSESLWLTCLIPGDLFLELLDFLCLLFYINKLVFDCLLLRLNCFFESLDVLFPIE